MSSSCTTILFATDSGYVRHLATAIYSLLLNNQSASFDIIVFTADISREDQARLQSLANQFNSSLQFKFLDDSYFDGLPLGNHFQKANYYRLFAAELISSKTCLYLDADIVVNGSIAELLDLQLNESYLAAVENPGFNRHRELGMRQDSGYFNSGVMLMNLEKWRKDGIRDQVVSLVRAKPNAIRYVDQCGLNAVVDGQWTKLDDDLNFQTGMAEARMGVDRSRDVSSVGAPTIVHFTGSMKPWHWRSKHPYKPLYWFYRNKTPYRSLLPDDFTAKNILARIIP